MSRYIPGTAEGDLLIAQAIAGAVQEEVAKQLRHYLPEVTYAPVVARDSTARTVTVDLYGRSEYRVTLPLIGNMPEGGQVQVQLLPNGQSYAQPTGGAAGPIGETPAEEPSDETLPLAVYPTPNTLGLYTGQWSQVAHGSLQRFGNVSGIVMVGGNGPYTAAAPRGIFRFNIAQPDSLGSVPLVSLELVDGSVVVAADLVLVTTAVNTSETEYQIHARVTGRDRFLSFLPLITHQHHAQHEWLGCSDFAVSLPAGTQYAATAVSGGGGGALTNPGWRFVPVSPLIEVFPNGSTYTASTTVPLWSAALTALPDDAVAVQLQAIFKANGTVIGTEMRIYHGTNDLIIATCRGQINDHFNDATVMAMLGTVANAKKVRYAIVVAGVTTATAHLRVNGYWIKES